MADYASSTAANGQDSVAEATRQNRESSITNGHGDAVGPNYVVPKRDFAQFLGYKNATPEETHGDQPLTGGRILELTLQHDMQQLGQGAEKHGTQFESIGSAGGHLKDQPGRERDMIKEGLHAMHEALSHDEASERAAGEEKARRLSPTVSPYYAQVTKLQGENHNDNVKYLEMQYKFQEMSKQQGTISNLMKTRNDCISRAIRGSQGS